MKHMILHRKDSLIITTIDIIDDIGIQGLSTREIAKRESISEATLFRHYKNKSDLLIAVLDYYSKFDQDLFHSTQLMNLNAKEAIRFYFATTVEYYENYPALTSIVQLFDVLRYDKDLSDKVIEILKKRFNYLRELIAQAKDKKELKEESVGDELADLIGGILLETTLRWRFSGRRFSLKKQTIATLDLVLKTYFI